MGWPFSPGEEAIGGYMCRGVKVGVVRQWWVGVVVAVPNVCCSNQDG